MARTASGSRVVVPAGAPSRWSQVTEYVGASGRGWCSSGEATSANTRATVPGGRLSRMAAAAGSPVSSATSRYQSVSGGGA